MRIILALGVVVGLVTGCAVWKMRADLALAAEAAPYRAREWLGDREVVQVHCNENAFCDVVPAAPAQPFKLDCRGENGCRLVVDL